MINFTSLAYVQALLSNSCFRFGLIHSVYAISVFLFCLFLCAWNPSMISQQISQLCWAYLREINLDVWRCLESCSHEHEAI